MRGSALIALGGLALMTAATPSKPASAGPGVRLDRAEVEPAWFPGYARVRLFVTAITLEGAVIPVPGDAWSIYIGGAKKNLPVLTGSYADVGGELAVGIVVHTGFGYAADMARLKEELRDFTIGLPRHAHVSVVNYGDMVQGGRTLATPAHAARRIESLGADTAPGDSNLLKAVERGVNAVFRATPETPGAPMRRLLIVVSDGIDVDPTPARYRALGDSAAKRGVPIHSIAYSSEDNRRPLLGLGELSKRSGGTFRWVRNRDGFHGQLSTLGAEVQRQYVLTYFAKRDAIAARRVGVGYKELRSNEVILPQLACGEETCEDGEYCAGYHCISRAGSAGSSWLRWLLMIGGGVLGLFAVLFIVSFFVNRPAEASPLQTAPVPSAAPIPSHRIVAANWDGERAGAAPAAAAPPQGQRRPAHRAAPPRPVAGAPTGSLLVVTGPGAGRTIPLSHGFIIGTASNCHLPLPGDRSASPQHAHFLVDSAGGCTLVDRASNTGTFVNGVRATETRLRHGVLITIGECELRFVQH